MDGTALGFVLAFNLGLLSQLHCVAMCGGVTTALCLAAGPQSWMHAAQQAMWLNAGRLTSYVAAGILAGRLGDTLGGAHAAGRPLLEYFAALMLVASGWRLIGFATPIRIIESAAFALWRRAAGRLQAALPRSRNTTYLVGLLWGALPCALVYTALALAAARGDALEGGLLMLAFGCGTLPALLAAYCLGARLPSWTRQPRVRRYAAALLIAAGCAYPFIDLWMARYTDHHAHGQGQVGALKVGFTSFPIVVEQGVAPASLQVIELTATDRPQEGPHHRDDEHRRQGNEEENHVHGHPVPRKRSALTMTTSELKDMPKAASQGDSRPQAAAGMASPL